MEIIIFCIFCMTLLGCIFFDQSILIALVIGFALFFSYGLIKKHSFMEMFCMALNGVKTVKNILITFMLIGMLTALWRASGTIAVIICYCSWMIRPTIFLFVSFLLNCLISFLTGTSFGTAATMGVICMTMGRTFQINPILIGGSVMSGIFFGDRCSPVSTSALLVSTLTETEIYHNIHKMIKWAAIPFAVTSGIYLILGFVIRHGEGNMDIWSFFSGEYHLHWIAVLPAAVIVVLSILRVKVKGTMLVSILTAIAVMIFIQDIPLFQIGNIILHGYKASDEQVAALLNGGGIYSMLRVSAIVCLSSSYAGMFEGTHMLDRMKGMIASTGTYLSPFAGILGVSVITAMISCNQTLSIMLTDQLCKELEPDNEKRAISLEDAPVMIAPLIPWSIAGAVPLAAIGATSVSLVAACYLYLVPLNHLLIEMKKY